MLGYVLVPTTPTPRPAHVGLGSEISRNEELIDIYRHTPHKSPHEVSRNRLVLLGTTARLCRNDDAEIETIHIICFVSI
jgi:hypothetical protein